jgi:hypothetical protein
VFPLKATFQISKNMRHLSLLLLAAAAFTGQAGAASIVTPSGITYTGTGIEFFNNENNLINGAGLSGTPTFATYGSITHGAADGGNAWVTDDPGPAGGDYFADSGGATIVFGMNFDQRYRLTDLVFWGYHFGGPNGNESREFRLEFSTNGGGSFGAPVVVSTPLSSFAVGNPLTLNFGGTVEANFVRMTVLDNHFGGSAPGGDRVGLGEVRFVGEAVPEPAVALLGSLGLLALLRRRRP